MNKPWEKSGLSWLQTIVPATLLVTREEKIMALDEFAQNNPGVENEKYCTMLKEHVDNIELAKDENGKLLIKEIYSTYSGNEKHPIWNSLSDAILYANSKPWLQWSSSGNKSPYLWETFNDDGSDQQYQYPARLLKD